MKLVMSLLALVAVAGFLAGTVLAADAVKPATWEGVFVKLDGAKVVMTVMGKDKSVLTTDKTVVTLDGKPAKLADLKAGALLTVTLVVGKGEIPTADSIMAKTPDLPKAPVPTGWNY
jgi:hypothetical protein